MALSEAEELELLELEDEAARAKKQTPEAEAANARMEQVNELFKSKDLQGKVLRYVAPPKFKSAAELEKWTQGVEPEAESGFLTQPYPIELQYPAGPPVSPLETKNVVEKVAKGLGLEDKLPNMPEGDKELLRAYPLLHPVDKAALQDKFIGVYGGAGFGGPPNAFGQALAVQREREKFKTRLTEAGFNPNKPPQKQNPLDVASQSLENALTVGLSDLAIKANTNVKELKEAAQKPQEDTRGFLDVMKDVGAAILSPGRAIKNFEKGSQQENLKALQEFQPQVYERLQKGDTSLSDDEIKEAVYSAIRQRRRAGEALDPGSAMLGEIPGYVLGETALAKTLGKVATKPAFIAGQEALRGAMAGDTPTQRVAGAVTGGLTGYAGGKIGEYLGTKVGEPLRRGGLFQEGIGGELQGLADVSRQQAFERQIDTLLAPLVTTAQQEGEKALTSKALRKAVKEASEIKAGYKAYEKAQKDFADLKFKNEADAAKLYSDFQKAQTQSEQDALRKAITQKQVAQKNAEKEFKKQLAKYENLKKQQAVFEDKVRAQAKDLAEKQLKVDIAAKQKAKDEQTALLAGRTGKLPKTPEALKTTKEELTEQLAQARERKKAAIASKIGSEGQIAANNYAKIRAYADDASDQIKEDIAAGKITKEDGLQQLALIEKEKQRGIDKFKNEYLPQVAEAEKQGVSIESIEAEKKHGFKLKEAEAEEAKILKNLEAIERGEIPDTSAPLPFNQELYEQVKESLRQSRLATGLEGVEEKVPALAEKIYKTQRPQLLQSVNQPNLAKYLEEQKPFLAQPPKPPTLLSEKALAEQARKEIAFPATTPTPTPALLSRQEKIRQMAEYLQQTKPPPAPLSKAEIRARAQAMTATPETRAMLLTEYPDIEESLKPLSAYTDVEKQKLAKAGLLKGAPIDKGEAPVSVGLGPARVYFGRKDVASPGKLEEYLFSEAQRNLAREAAQTPLMTPLIQSPTAAILADIAKPIRGQPSYLWSLQEDSAPEELSQIPEWVKSKSDSVLKSDKKEEEKKKTK